MSKLVYFHLSHTFFFAQRGQYIDPFRQSLHTFRHTLTMHLLTHTPRNPGSLPVISWRSPPCILLSPPHLFTVITVQINIHCMPLAKAYYLTVWVSSLMWESRHWQRSGTPYPSSSFNRCCFDACSWHVVPWRYSHPRWKWVNLPSRADFLLQQPR